MIKLIRNFVQAKTREWENKNTEQEMISKVVGQTKANLDESNGIVGRSDVDGFQRIVNPQDTEKGHVHGEQQNMIRQSRKMYRYDPHARALIQSMVNYIIGKGFDVKPKSDDNGVKFVWGEFWNSERSNMSKKRFELITRLFRDGEVFLQFFSKNEKEVETGLTTCRFKDPLLCKNPFDKQASNSFSGSIEKIRNGIEINPEDIEEVVAYWFERRDKTGAFDKIEAEDMVHSKIFADSDQRRGETFLQTIMPMIANYNNWLDNRIILNRMRTAIVLIKKITGTTTELNAAKGNLGPQDQRGKTVIQGGKILIANAGVDYKMESPNINAADVADDGRVMKLAMVAGTNMPEWMLGDASNANFASSLIAESPFVKAIEYWQIFIEGIIKEIYKKVITNAVKAGKLTPPNDDEFMRKIFKKGNLTEAEEEELAQGTLESPSDIFFGCDVQWPEIIHRDFKEQVEGLGMARLNGWIADDTASAALGYDYDEEVRKQRKIDENSKKNGNPLAGIEDPAGVDDGDMEKEIDDVLNQIGDLSDEERKMILSADNSTEVANLLLARKNAVAVPAQGEE